MGVHTLTEGCWAIDIYSNIPTYIRERLFGNCRSLSRITLIRSFLVGTNLSSVDLSYAQLLDAGLVSTNLKSALLVKADLRGSRMSYINLIDADLTGANLSGSDLRAARLMGSKLDGADLSNVDFRDGVNLSGASLKNTNLNNVKFSCAFYKDDYGQERKLSCPNLQNITWNEGTNWQGIQGWETVENIPPALKQQLGLKDKQEAENRRRDRERTPRDDRENRRALK